MMLLVVVVGQRGLKKMDRGDLKEGLTRFMRTHVYCLQEGGGAAIDRSWHAARITLS